MNNLTLHLIRNELLIFWNKLASKRKIQFIGILLFTVIVSIVEVISIESLLPFTAFLTNPSYLVNNSFFLSITEYFSKRYLWDFIKLNSKVILKF